MKTLCRWFFSLSAEDWVIFLSDPSGLKAVCDQCLQCSSVKKLETISLKQNGNGGRNQLIVLKKKLFKGTVLLICWHNCHCWSLEHEGNWKLRRRLFLKEYTATWKSGVTLQVQTGNLWGKGSDTCVNLLLTKSTLKRAISVVNIDNILSMMTSV